MKYAIILPININLNLVNQYNEKIKITSHISLFF